MAKVKPILFSAPMVLAMLDGRKTQTRRVMTPESASFGSASQMFWEHADFGCAFVDGRPEHGQYLRVPCHQDTESGDCILCRDMGWGGTVHRLWPRIEPGDLLWVRETHAVVPSTAYRMSEGVQQTVNPGDPDMASVYAAGWERSKPQWRPSIHMPKWASRLTLEVTGVKVERLQEISEADARAEGIEPVDEFPFGTVRYRDYSGTMSGMQSPIKSFRSLWDSLNAKRGYGWDENPWVIALTFTTHRQNVDAILAERCTA